MQLISLNCRVTAAVPPYQTRVSGGVSTSDEVHDRAVVDLLRARFTLRALERPARDGLCHERTDLSVSSA